jgi:Mrp family chromosome partitioning ATPase
MTRAGHAAGALREGRPEGGAAAAMPVDRRAQLPPPQFLAPADGGRLFRALENAAGLIRSPVQFIAARDGEGTSSLARDFSLICARELNQRVLLLDIDPPGGGQAKWFARHRVVEVGAADPDLATSQFGFQEIGEAGLHLNNWIPPNPLTGAQWRAVFGVLQTLFDIVVIDAPPLVRSFDGVSLSAHVATNILVVEAEATQAAAARDLRDRIEDLGGHISGCLMNKRRVHLPDWLARRL